MLEVINTAGPNNMNCCDSYNLIAKFNYSSPLSNVFKENLVIFLFYHVTCVMDYMFKLTVLSIEKLILLIKPNFIPLLGKFRYWRPLCSYFFIFTNDIRPRHRFLRIKNNLLVNNATKQFVRIFYITL